MIQDTGLQSDTSMQSIQDTTSIHCCVQLTQAVNSTSKIQQFNTNKLKCKTQKT